MMQVQNNWLRWAVVPVLLALGAWAGRVQAQEANTRVDQGQVADAARFSVLEFRVQGATLLSAIAIERAVYPFMGPQKTLDDVQRASDALEKAFHDAGYLTVVVSIPQQKVDDGVVLLQVTQAPVDRLRVLDSRYFSPSQIKAAVPELAEGVVPNFPDMQEELGMLLRNPDRRITPVLRPGKAEGTVDVDLKVEDHLPLHGNVDINNRYTPPGWPTHMSAGLHWDNLWGEQHSLGLSVQTVPEDPTQSTSYTLNYNIPLSSGNSVALYAVNSNSNMIYSDVNTTNVSNGHVYGMRYLVNLPALGDMTQTAMAGVDFKAFGQTTGNGAGGGFDTPITYMPFVLGWDGSWRSSERSSKVGIAFNFHSREFVGSEEDFSNKAYKAHPGYGYFRGTLDHNETWASGWNVDIRSSWQLSAQALVSNEQFFIGGADTVRGYTESIAGGDAGAILTLEAVTPNMWKVTESALEDAHFVFFMDSGAVQLMQPLPSLSQRISLSSTGVGLRLRGSHGLNAALDFAWALRDLVSVSPAVHAGDSRMHFRISYEW